MNEDRPVLSAMEL